MAAQFPQETSSQFSDRQRGNNVVSQEDKSVSSLVASEVSFPGQTDIIQEEMPCSFIELICQAFCYYRALIQLPLALR